MAGGKSHAKRKSGRKADKKKAKDAKRRELGGPPSVAAGAGAAVAGLGKGGKKVRSAPKAKGDPGANPKAFAFQSAGKAKAAQARSAEKEQRRLHAPLSERAGDEPPPLLVLVHGPPQVGKSSLIRGLVKHFTKQSLADPRGPITVVTGKRRRITLLECPPDLPGMMDAAKVADLVLLLIDGAFGLEMETFEFLNLLQVHGFPKVMGVLTHLDGFREAAKLKKAKKALKARFWAEVYDGAKLFYLSGMTHGRYLKREILNLARFISVAKTRPLSWRLEHPYLLADRLEDVTPPEVVRLSPKADRSLLVYGYLRGAPLRPARGCTSRAWETLTCRRGAGEVDALPDPCPLPHQEAAAAAAPAAGAEGGAAKPARRRTLSDRQRLIHAPMADLGGMLFDRDAVYIDLPDWKVQYSTAAAAAAASGDAAAAAAAAAAAGAAGGSLQEGEAMVRGLAGARLAVDEKLQRSRIQLFGGSSTGGGAGAAWRGSGDSDGSGSDGEGTEGEEESGSGGEDDEGSDGDDGSGDGEGASSGSGSESEGDDGGGGGARPRCLLRGMPRGEQRVAAGGRLRRRALFEPDEGDEAEEAARGGGGGGPRKRQRRAASDDDAAPDAADADGEEDEDEGLGAAAAWKSRIQERLASLFAARGADLASLVYGTPAAAAAPGAGAGGNRGGGGGAAGRGGEDGGGGGEGSDSDGEDFFTLKLPGGGAAPGAQRRDGGGAAQVAAGLLAAGARGVGAGAGGAALPAAVAWLDAPDSLDSSRPAAAAAAAASAGGGLPGGLPAGPGFSLLDLDARWGAPGAVAGLRDRFVTGDWDAAAARAAAARGASDDGDDEGEEGDVFGDFEDVEAGLTFAPGDAATEAARRAIADATAEELRAKKIAKRAAWDAGFASGGAAGAAAAAAAADRGAPPPGSDDGKGDDDGDDGDAGAGGAAQRPRRAGGARPGDARRARGPRAGDLRAPAPQRRAVRAGGALGPAAPAARGRAGQGETRMGVMRLRLKRHRWYPRILKTRDPLLLSVGWRRFQSMPVYALEDHNRRLRALKYTPQHAHCLAALYGPLAPPNTGVVAVHASAAGPTPPSSWRIAATAVVLEQDAELRVVKKLKLVGTPLKLEAARFEGAAVTTVSGIRGTIKRALRAGVQGVPDGGVRVTFEDKPLLSDIVFLRAWVAVDIPRLHVTASNLLAPPLRLAHAAGVTRKGHAPAPDAAAGAAPARQQQQQQQQQGQQASAAPAPAPAGGAGFAPAPRWSGPRPGCLRRAAGVGAPVVSDSLYRPVVRAPRVFNPLKVPAKLQAALPFKTKPKVEAPRKRKTLEAKRAVVLDKPEKAAAALLAQLNAIRNAKADKRRAAGARRREAQAKKAAKEAEWRDRYSKDQRKTRYVAQGQAAKRAAAAAEGGGGGGKGGGKGRKRPRADAPPAPARGAPQARRCADLRAPDSQVGPSSAVPGIQWTPCRCRRAWAARLVCKAARERFCGATAISLCCPELPLAAVQEAWRAAQDGGWEQQVKQYKLAEARAACGDVAGLAWLCRAGCSMDDVCRVAARNGQFAVLEWAWREGLDLRDVCKGAAWGGQLAVLRWARAQTPPLPWGDSGFGVCSSAAGRGDLEMLRWARGQDEPAPWDRNACKAAADNGHLETLRWLRANGCPWWREGCEGVAAWRGDAAVVAWIRAQSDDGAAD
ncbi:BMS1 [Scenedesmus sp. PABB004]|nr:BMS1 [Scenedesmus sp. PABB004]